MSREDPPIRFPLRVSAAMAFVVAVVVLVGIALALFLASRPFELY